MYAAICLNGHLCDHVAVRTSMSSARRALERVHSETPWFPAFCSECGEKVLDACSECGKHFNEVDPKFCRGCGVMLPWTTRSLEAARELTDSLAELTPQQKMDFTTLIPQLAFVTPRAELACRKLAPAVASLLPDSKDLLTKILTAVITDGAMRALKLKP